MSSGRLQFNNVTLRIGSTELLVGASAQVAAGAKVGLVGRNGAGKSSLLKLIMGQLSEDDGELGLPKSWRIAYLTQSLPDHDVNILDFIKAGDAQWLQISTMIQQAEEQHQGEKLAELYAQLEAIDGYRVESRASVILQGLGFAQHELSSTVKSFSGGWQMRLQLACVLMSRADLIMLDEPTNHLDFETIYWLESWLQQSKATIVVISHDRDFLDRTTDHTLYITAKKIQSYVGNYSSFAKQFQEALVLQQKSNVKVLHQRAHLQSYVDRFRAKASKAKQAQSRLKSLEKLEINDALQAERGMAFEFLPTVSTGYPTISLRADLGYIDKTILPGVQLNIGDGHRIGVIGKNGSGKSTLLKSIAGQLAILQGEMHSHSKTNIGYFSQDQVDMLNPSESALDHLFQQEPKISDSEARRFLGYFGFNNDRVFEQVGVFSGGERARLALALLVRSKPNVLVMDEPTNHLDMHVREALIMALQGFAGALLLVSHDRHFLECCVDELWLVQDAVVDEFKGSLQDYERTLLVVDGSSSTTSNKPANKATRTQIRKIEKQLQLLQSRLKKVDQQLAEPNLYEDNEANKVSDLVKRQRDLQQQIDDLEDQWLSLSES